MIVAAVIAATLLGAAPPADPPAPEVDEDVHLEGRPQVVLGFNVTPFVVGPYLAFRLNGDWRAGLGFAMGVHPRRTSFVATTPEEIKYEFRTDGFVRYQPTDYARIDVGFSLAPFSCAVGDDCSNLRRQNGLYGSAYVAVAAGYRPFMVGLRLDVGRYVFLDGEDDIRGVFAVDPPGFGVRLAPMITLAFRLGRR